MSRIGNQPINIPDGVNINISNGVAVVSGPKGEMTQALLPGVSITTADNQLVVSRNNDNPKTRAAHGLIRSLLANMITGVSKGFERKLELNGVGYRVANQGQDLKFNIGFSHDVIYKLPPGIQAAIDQNVITVSGIDKQRVGQAAAEIRALKKPEPYKGKGIKYSDEQIIRKSGKSGKETA